MLQINTDISSLGYYEKPITFDTNGDIEAIEYYKGYDEVTETYSNLKYRETRVYLRDTGSGLVIKKTTTREFYKSGTVVNSTTTSQYYDARAGYVANQKARRNLLDNASMWLLGSLQAEFGTTDGETKGKEFLNDVKSEFSTYRRGDISHLLTAISNSSRSYMTQSRKDTLDGILNITYG